MVKKKKKKKKKKLSGATSRVGSAYPTGAPIFIPGV
jgi:hypothetical protein